MEFKFKYKLTAIAQADLDNIISYIAIHLSNPKAATDFADKLQKAIDDVRYFPESGSLVINDFLPTEGVRKKIIGNYIMYYFLDNASETILILRIVYGRRNVDEIMRQFDSEK